MCTSFLVFIGRWHERSEGHGKQAEGAFGEMGVIGCINGFELLTG
jgi:hypothetical protein